MNRDDNWRSVSFLTVIRALARGWTWIGDPRSGRGRALRSPGGIVYEFRARPPALRRYHERRFADAA